MLAIDQGKVLALALMVALSAAPATVAAQSTTQPAGGAAQDATSGGAVDPRLELRANQAYNRGEYAAALPLLKRLAEEAAQQPSRRAAIEERIRVCERALAAVKSDPQAAANARLTIEPPPTAEARKPHVPPKQGECYETTIQGLGNFEYDQENGGAVPEDVRRLSGSNIRLRGYMIPMDQAENITQFALVPSLFACCFGQPPQIQHTIVVNCPKGKAVGYTPDEIVVEGKLNVQEKKDEGYIVSLFDMIVSSVKAAPK